jgi:type II secretory pathway pseudopilin PulG
MQVYNKYRLNVITKSVREKSALEYSFQRKSLGITIVELMVAITVLALLTPVVLFTLGNYYEDNLNSVASSSQDADVRRALTTIQNDLKDARGFRAALTVSNSTAPLGSTNGATGNGNWSYCGTSTTSVTCDGITVDNGTTNRVLIAYSDLTDGDLSNETTSPVYIDDGQEFNLATAVTGTFAYVYFVAPDRSNPSQNNLYRRTIVQVDPSTADTYKSVSSGLRATPFQKTTCASTVVAANSSVCLERDAILLSNVKSFWVDYFDESNQKISGYYSNNATTASVAANSLKANASTIKIRITKQMTTLSKRISQASGIINVNTISKSMSATAGPSYVTNGLVLNLDAGNTSSYPGTGTTWTDLSGNGNNAELVNSPTFNTLNSGYLQFVTDDFARIPNNTALDTQTPTVEVWVKTNATTQNGFWFEKGTVNTQYSLFQEGGSIQWRQRLTSNLTNLSTPTATYMNTSNWYQVVGTYSSGERKLYINGALVNSDTQSGTIATSAGGMSIGVYGGFSGSRGYYYNGNLASVKIYNRALTAPEVQQNFDALKTRFGL